MSIIVNISRSSPFQFGLPLHWENKYLHIRIYSMPAMKVAASMGGNCGDPSVKISNIIILVVYEQRGLK